MSDCTVETVKSSVIVMGLADTLPKPSVDLLGASGGVVDPADITSIVMHFDDVKPESLVDPLYTPVSFTVAGVQVGNEARYEFALTGTQTANPITWRTKVVITEAGDTYTRPTAYVHVVDFADLWASPDDVKALAPGFSFSDYAGAVLAAEAAVRAWVTTPVSSPVSERVSYAVALLAARVLTTPPTGANIVSETMGDYSVRYGRNAPGGLILTDDIKELLAPWKPVLTTTYVGPDDSGSPAFWTELVSA